MSFSQFTISSVNLPDKILTNHHLNLAFQLFDKDGLGVINADGINTALGDQLSEEEVRNLDKVINEID